MNSTALLKPDAAPTLPATRIAAQFVVGAIFVAIVLGSVVNLSMPWESDQPAKAAQILEIAHRHDYWLSSDVPGCYFLKMLPLYYSASGLLYTAIGGDIFRFMNLCSVFFGVIAGLSAAWALYNAFRIAPIWVVLTLLCIPLFVITCSYGNETAWSLAFFWLSLALVSTTRRALHYAAGCAVACSVFCRPDVVLLAPYWLAWSLLFCNTDAAETWLKRLLRPTAAFLITSLILFLLLIREIPHNPTSFEWNLNLKLIAAFFAFPFNPTIVLLGAIGWVLLLRQRRSYAWAHLLLLLPIAFYIRNLSSPKYIIFMLLFYGLPAAYLFDRASNLLRSAMVATVAIWFFVGVSIYGVFGPVGSSLWYLPTADGPCPIGGYLAFYSRARNGEYQVKQAEHIALTRDFVEFAKHSDGHYWIAGYWLQSSLHLLRAWGELGSADEEARVDRIANAPGSRSGEQPNDGSAMLLLRTGYLDASTLNDELANRLRTWLSKGQVRPVGPGAAQPLPTLIEVGDHIPDGQNSSLGRRLLFAIDLYEGHMVFEQPEFITPYRPTSWAAAGTQADVEPIYRDEQVAAFDRPVENAKVFSYAWPGRYYQLKSPIPKFRGHLAK